MLINIASPLPPPAHPVSPVRLIPRLSGPGPYRLATICLATLCAVLLISIIAVTAHCETVRYSFLHFIFSSLKKPCGVFLTTCGAVDRCLRHVVNQNKRGAHFFLLGEPKNSLKSNEI